MTEDERCAGRFWWRGHLRLSDDGVGVWVKNIHHNPVLAKDVATEAIAGEKNPHFAIEKIAACVACLAHADAYPTLTARELLDLPEPEPTPAKSLGKAEIAAAIRNLWKASPIATEGYRIRIHEQLAAAVEALPAPAPTKPTYHVGKHAFLDNWYVLKTDAEGTTVMRAYSGTSYGQKAQEAAEEDARGLNWGWLTLTGLGPNREIPEPGRVSPFAAKVASLIQNTRSNGPPLLRTAAEAVVALAWDFGLAMDPLLVASPDPEAPMEHLVELAATCQRVAEDIGLVEKVK